VVFEVKMSIFKIIFHFNYHKNIFYDEDISIKKIFSDIINFDTHTSHEKDKKISSVILAEMKRQK